LINPTHSAPLPCSRCPRILRAAGVLHGQSPHLFMKRSIPFVVAILSLRLGALVGTASADVGGDDLAWLQKSGTLIFHDAFEREIDGNHAEAIGNGWHSATADRVPHLKQAAIDAGTLKIASATKEAGHAAHIHHEAGFEDGGILVRFRFPGESPNESLQLGFVDREAKGVHAGHLCYAIVSPSGMTLTDWKTGVMNLEIRKLRGELTARKEALPADLEALLKSKQTSVQCRLDHEWHELVLVTEGDEMRASLDGGATLQWRSSGFAHPTKRWLSFLVGSTVWIDDVKIWKVK